MKVTIYNEGTEFTSWYQGARLTIHCTDKRTIFSKYTLIWQPESGKGMICLRTHDVN